MKIECKLKRKGGSHVTIEGTAYHFAPQADGKHVADVKNAKHAERFLDIPEAYAAVEDAKPKTMPDPVAEPDDSDKLKPATRRRTKRTVQASLTGEPDNSGRAGNDASDLSNEQDE